MNKKLIIIFIILGLVVIGGVIGFICYRNTPDYVMKEYVKANNKKNNKLLEQILYNSNSYKPMDIQHGYDIKVTDKIISYKVKKSSSNNLNNKIKNEILDSNDEIIDSISYTANLKSGNTCIVILGKINNEWKVVFSPLCSFE